MCTYFTVAALAAWFRRNTLPLIVGSYATAVVVPNPGLWIRDLRAGSVAVYGEPVSLTGPMVMIALLLFAAGLAVDRGRLRELVRHPLSLCVGVGACVAVPVLLAAALAVPLVAVAGHAVGGALAAGLVVVAVMPMSSASAVWVTRAGGDAALGVGLVVVMTGLSMLLAPIQLAVAAALVDGLPTEWGTGPASGLATLLMVTAVVPAAIGMACRAVVGTRAFELVHPHTTLATGACVLLLGYSNAALVLPQFVSQARWEVAALALAAVGGYCAARFGTGWCAARLARSDRPAAVAVMLGVGTSNTGAGLVFAAPAAAHEPLILVPLLLYTLVQHLTAGAMEVAHTLTAVDDRA